MAGNGLNMIRKYMINYFPKSKMAAKSRPLGDSEKPMKYCITLNTTFSAWLLV